MSAEIEVESRALVPAKERSRILAALHAIGEVVVVDRLMVDYSGIDRTQTVVVRVNNGVQEVVTKTGGLSDAARVAVPRPVSPGVPLEETLADMAAKGHTRAMVSLRRMFTVRDGTFEYSLRDVLDQRTLEIDNSIIEVERLDVQPGEERAAEAQTDAAIESLGLEVLDGDGYREWVADVYRRVDQPFEYSPAAATALVQSLPAVHVS